MPRVVSEALGLIAFSNSDWILQGICEITDIQGWILSINTLFCPLEFYSEVDFDMHVGKIKKYLPALSLGEAGEDPCNQMQTTCLQKSKCACSTDL